MFKKRVFLAIACMAIMALVLVGCSGKKESPTPSQASQSAPVAEQGTTASAPTVTVASYLAQFGLTEDDIKPVAFTSFELGDDSVVIRVSNQDDVYTWFKQVYDKTKSIADDGKIYNDMYPYVEGEHMWTEPTAGTVNRSWAYIYNGTTVRAQTLFDTGYYLLSIY